MPCSKEEALIRLFYNVSSSLKLLFLFLSLSFIFLSKFFYFVGSNPIFPRNQNGYENMFSDEEEEMVEEEELEEERCYHYDQTSTENEHLVADIIRGGEALLFMPNDVVGYEMDQNLSDEQFLSPQESTIEEEEDDEEEENYPTELISMHDTDEGTSEDDEYFIGTKIDAQIKPRNQTDSNRNSVSKKGDWPTSPIITIELEKDMKCNDKNFQDYYFDMKNNKDQGKVETNNNFYGEDKFFVIGPTQLETRKLQQQVDNKEKNVMIDEEVYGDSCTVGSTSKSSSEWRSSIYNCRDSGTEDPFSSSSRRSCPKWESYTVFQKYDEEMLFLDRISAQKLHETESLRSIKVSPRSVSERIVRTLATINKKPADIRQNPYHELEATYVAQICLAWEALNWNYKKFQQKRALHRDFDPGSPAQIAQQFQQFQVLLQRYIENEPYEQGRRPEIYARMRLLAPKLLQVPEYRESEDDQRDEGLESRISSPEFLIIMEDCIRTFMNFLKADKERTCQVLAAFFKRKRRGSIDPTLLHLIKKVNQKKKIKVKDLRRSRKCLRKRRLNVDEEMEILMALIDLKVVSRVLRMKELSEEQMHWCEEKLSKVRVLDGKLQRDSSPLFFPAH